MKVNIGPGLSSGKKDDLKSKLIDDHIQVFVDHTDYVIAEYVQKQTMIKSKYTKVY